MLKRPMPFASIALAVFSLFVAGCHSVPLGDPEKSVADPAMAGWWLSDEFPALSDAPSHDSDAILAYVSPFDARAFVMTAYVFTPNGGKPTRVIKVLFKAWMTNVAGMDIMCLKFIDPEWGLNDGGVLGGNDVKSRYMYFRIRKTVDGMMQAACLNVNLLKETKSPQELAKKIADNVNNPELCNGWFLLTFRSVPKEKQDQVRKIVDLWDQGKK
jgi:hypothetical protein